MTACPHDTPRPFRVCRHLLEREQVHVVRFTGSGVECELVCRACEAARDLVAVCEACREAAEEGGAIRIAGEPGIIELASTVTFAHDRVAGIPPLLDLQPVLGADQHAWIGLTPDGVLHRIDLDRGETRRLAVVPHGVVDLDQAVILRLSRDASVAAIAGRHGTAGVVVDLATGRPTMLLRRDGYRSEHGTFPLAFLERGGRPLIVCSPEWNRLDVFDARSGELLTARAPTSYRRGEPQPAHYLDYFHCGLVVSPDQRWIAANGWMWAPVGVVATWSVERWLADNVWESEDGPTRRALCGRGYVWDAPLCWVGDARLAVWGYGDDDPLLPAARIFDAATGVEERWFAGPRGELAFDRVLVGFDPEHGAEVWDLERGARIARDPGAAFVRHHPTARTFVTLPARDGVVIVSRMRGLDAAWDRGVIGELARAIARDHRFEDLPVLGDALEQAGYEDREALAHCRSPGAHGERCWVIDRLIAG